MRMLAVINSLETGGAEVNLVRLACGLRARGIDLTILPLKKGGALRDLATRSGVAVLEGGMASILRARSDRWPIVEGWMYVGAVVASAIATKGARVIWNLRHVPVDLRAESLTTRFALQVLRRLPRPDRIHVNSVAAIDVHRQLGLDADYRLTPNGIDTAQYRFDADAAAAFRRQEAIADGASLIVQIGRRHPHKGQQHLLTAAKMLLQRGYPVVVAFVGDGTEALRGDAEAAGLEAGACRFLGHRSDVVPALSAADVVVNPSLTESSPTAVAEAMSCGAVCVATDAGETSALIGGAGVVVPVGDPSALADGIFKVLTMASEPRRQLGAAARVRIETNYGMPLSIDRYIASIVEVARAF